MWESICLTLAATAGNNIGKVLQKKGTLILPPLSFKLKVIRAYAANKAWIIGFLIDICGALLMLRALSQAPVSVIQPVSGCGLAILSVFSHFYLKEVMNVIDWIGITLAGIGTIGVGAGGEEQEASSVSIFQLPWLGFLVALLFVVLNGWLRVYRHQRRAHEMMDYEVVEEIIYGLESGILFGCCSARLQVLNAELHIICRMASVISKMGFVFMEQGFSRMLVPICVSISICCSATGFYYQTQGLKHGRAIVVSTCAAVASIVTGVLAGMLALGEQLPSAPTARFLLLLGWLFIVVGVILLVSSTWLLRHLPLRRFIRINVDRNFSLSRSGSLRLKDSNPAAVIHAATLHHLISSPSKEKA
nr:probable magnesium transporter NIPA9 isoform X1 [Populus alba]